MKPSRGFLLLALLLPSASARAVTIFSEGFEDASALPAAGWALVNNSSPLGTTDWFQGIPAIFPAASGDPEDYVAANFLNGDLGGDISNWLITPELSIENGDVISFFTRSAGTPEFADRLELRLSTSGASTDVGATAASVGDFGALLFTVNPTLLPDGYPDDWVLVSATIAGLSMATSGRYAFHYFVPDTSVNGDYIGIDGFRIERLPEPSVAALLAFGTAVLLGWRRRR